MKLPNIISYVLVILIPLIIIFGNFRILAYNFNFYQLLYQKSGTYQTFLPNEVKDHTVNLFGFFRGKNKLDPNFYSKQAVLHLNDVKSIFKEINSLLYYSLIIFSLSAIYLYFKSPELLLTSLYIGSALTAILIFILAIGSLIGFGSFFESFHRLLFRNDLWQFPPEDTLIQLFPAQFFQIFANVLAVNILVSSLFIAFSSHIIKNKKNAAHSNFFL